MRVPIQIFNTTTSEQVFTCDEPDIDSAIAQLGAFKRHMIPCKTCGEPTEVDGYCCDECEEMEQLNLQEARIGDLPF